jgi:hypothetical protein
MNSRTSFLMSAHVRGEESACQREWLTSCNGEPHGDWALVTVMAPLEGVQSPRGVARATAVVRSSGEPEDERE